MSICSVYISGTSPLSAVTEAKPSVIILSGGPHSVHQEGAPVLPQGFWDYVLHNEIFVLGICYGLQLMVQMMGGQVKSAESQEYGRMEIRVQKGISLYGDSVEERQAGWMSHGGEVVRLPEGFSIVATSLQNAVAAIENPAKKLYGLKYHPEVTHSVNGVETLHYFLFSVCGIEADWKFARCGKKLQL
ncbi:hypothetical protein SUGI_0290950 [Cryptomeria japonica]|uniref:uncharacterized protein LOC131068406 n=1 Tax=Cryptomeria japonica TaxID=3369 RepID=UPI002408D1C3|nr:uncharacterized protein LOC131068406 [Cryptomeria japonica]GLJ16873.1 hypothetical protein SUGI_0290950 [Cryptomeria japonica]